MVFAPLDSTYLSSDSDKYDALVKLIHESHIGGVIAFGGSEPVPQVMLNPTYSPIILGQPMELASLLNRLQAVSALPLLASSDFEWGAGMRIAGATKFPRAMAFGAAGDPQLAYEAGRITGVESRGMGVHIDFGPVADVNNNPRNPVINIRSFGEDPARVGAMVAGWVKGVQEAGHARHAQAFSRARRHRRRFASRPADHPAPARAVRRRGAAAVQGRHRKRGGGRDGGAHRAAGDRSGERARRRSARK